MLSRRKRILLFSSGSGGSIASVIPLIIINGEFANAIIDPWVPQHTTITFEIFDTRNAVKLANSGNYSMIKQAVDCTPGATYTVKALIHNNNWANNTSLIAFDTDLELVDVGSSHNSLMMDQIIALSSTGWQEISITFVARSNRVTIALEQIGTLDARVSSISEDISQSGNDPLLYNLVDAGFNLIDDGFNLIE